MKPSRTGGGRFDPTARALYFLSLTNGSHTRLMVEEHEDGNLLRAPHLLAAVNYINRPMESAMRYTAAHGAAWFIDSGVYNLSAMHALKHGLTFYEALTTQPEDLDGWDDLYVKYVDICRRWEDLAWGYTELDQGGRESKIRLRAGLEKIGLRPIPVYHPLTDGWDYFDHLAERYDRIAFGNVVGSDKATRTRLIATAWERKRKYPNLWVHLLGLTPNEITNALPVDSCDSSSWVAAVRWEATTTHAMQRSLGPLRRDYRYIVGAVRTESGYDKGCILGALSAALEERSALHWHETLMAAGIDPYARTAP